MNTIVAIAVAIGFWKGQTTPPAKPPEAVSVARPAATADKPPRHKAEWPLGY